MCMPHDGRDASRPPANLRVRTFSNYPDLAAWCRPRIADAEQRHFAMGHGAAFVTLVGFLRSAPGADITLLAFTEAAANGRAERLKSVIACLKRDAVAAAQMPANAVLLYQRGD